jgi:hypothetical protein
MLFSGKLVKLEIIMLIERDKSDSKTNITFFLSYVESGPEILLLLIMMISIKGLSGVEPVGG